MPKGKKHSTRTPMSTSPAAAEAAESLSGRLRVLAPTADAEAVHRAVGADEAAVTLVAQQIAETGDESGLMVLSLLAKQQPYAFPVIEGLARARNEHAARLLAVIAGVPVDREAGKAARRALHVLASSGVAAPIPRPAGTAVYQMPPQAGVAWRSAIAGPIDADGLRSVLLGQATLPVGAATAVAVLSEERGILFFQAARHTHRQVDKEWQHYLAERDETRAVEVPFDYAQYLLAEAADRMAAAGGALPDEYTAWLEFSGGRPSGEYSAFVYEEAGVDPEAVDEAALDRSDSLIDEPEIAPWSLPAERFTSYATELIAAQASPLVISEAAEADRLRKLAARAADEQLDAELRERYGRRLEETALLFLRSDRYARAGDALAAASALKTTSTAPSAIPFAVALAQRALVAARDAPSAGVGSEPAAGRA